MKQTHLQRKLNASRGFTLVELMVVILIIAVLAAVVVPRVLSRQDEAKISAAKADISTLASALNQFRLDTDRFPTSEEGLSALTQPPSDVDGWKGPYIEKAIPTDPWKGEYIYQYPGPQGEDTFMLMSYGKGGAPGGEGNETDISNGDL